MDRTAQDILDDLDGNCVAPPSRAEVRALCERALDADRLEARDAALMRALRVQLGLVVIDTTTDDDDGTVLQLVSLGEE